MGFLGGCWEKAMPVAARSRQQGDLISSMLISSVLISRMLARLGACVGRW
jgi:hypothetical protein